MTKLIITGILLSTFMARGTEPVEIIRDKTAANELNVKVQKMEECIKDVDAAIVKESTAGNWSTNQLQWCDAKVLKEAITYYKTYGYEVFQGLPSGWMVSWKK
jgi:hypothetical protein